LIDLYPTTSALSGLPVPENIQGRDLSPLFDDPSLEVRDAAFSVAPMRKGFLLRTNDYAFIQYGEDAFGGIELFDMKNDPGQFTNLASAPEQQERVAAFRQKMADRLFEVRDNDLPTQKLEAKLH
jgi:iduronate 2-sulfatase